MIFDSKNISILYNKYTIIMNHDILDIAQAPSAEAATLPYTLSPPTYGLARNIARLR